MVNEWTADDLPVAFEDSKRPGQYWNPSSDMMRDLVVWLNAHHPKPPRGDAALADHLGRQAEAIDELQLDLEAAERERDRWRRAHEIVEGERDLARERLREVETALAKCTSDYQDVEDERDEAGREVSTWRSSTESAHSDFLQAEHERDEWKARAVKAESERDHGLMEIREFREELSGAYARAEKAEAERDRAREDWRQAERKRLALLAKAEPAPTVAREEVAGKLRQAPNVFSTSDDDLLHIADNILTLFGIYESDPVLSRAREYATAVGIDWDHAEPEDVDLLMKVAEHVIGQETDDE